VSTIHIAFEIPVKGKPVVLVQDSKVAAEKYAARLERSGDISFIKANGLKQ